MREPLLEARNVSVQFGRGPLAIEAVSNASVALYRGEIVGIVGESGSGKSTLARVLAGLQIPSRGDVVFDGLSRRGSGGAFLPGAERRRIQMVFQDPYGSLNPRMRAVEAVAEAVSRWQGIRSGPARAEGLALLDSLGISRDQAHQLPRRLSGGQRQRVSMARAIAPRPDVLIADEPTSSIDQSAQAQLLNLLVQLRRERGLAIVFISHDLGVIRYLTERVYVMKDGRILEDGKTTRVFDTPEHDYTRRLINAIPGRGRHNCVAENPSGRVLESVRVRTYFASVT